jgi:hypothetical protein
MDFGTVIAIANVAMKMYSLFNSKNASDRQVAEYDQQAALNRQIGAFNAEVAQRSGVEAVNAIALQTKRVVGEQMVSFANRGISMEGSPMYVIGDTLTMGSKRSQEAYLNSEVQRINYLYAAQGASATASAAAESASYKSLGKTVDIFKSFVEGAKLMNSMNSSGQDDAVKQSIFDHGRWMIS